MKAEYNFSQGERGKFLREGVELSLPVSDAKPDWEGPKGSLGRFIVEESKNTLASYRAQPIRVDEDVITEDDIAGGGYACRQLFELVQNSADALLDAPKGTKGESILIRLTERFLYCADNGAPIDRDGVTSLMFSRLSPKRGTDQIGMFGLGFKSVLGVSDAPEFFSRSGSFRFDHDRSRARIREVAPNAERCPALRLPEPIDPRKERDSDEELHELMNWATNIVRLPLKSGARDDLAGQIRDFPPAFLLFVDHVRYLTLEDGESSRSFTRRDQDGELQLDTGEGTARWLRFERTHCLSDDARADRRSGDNRDKVPVWWAAPLDRLADPGKFWAFFPTQATSLVAGILNAPWKTNEDRQNLLPGPYNEELIEAAAAMIAEALPELATNDDPARHLDALPRRRETGDSDQADLLRKRLFADLHERAIVPDQDGNLRARRDISYPPKELTDAGQEAAAAFERWAAYPGRPSNWLHHKALTRNTLAIVDRLFHRESEPPGRSSSGAPRAAVAEWLEALVEGKEADGAIQASMAAVQVAVCIPEGIRKSAGLGEIVLTAAGGLARLNPERLFLPDETQTDGDSTNTDRYVHPNLASNPDTRSALKKLGLKPLTPESRFELLVERISSPEQDDELHNTFWILSRKMTPEDALAIVRDKGGSGGGIRVQTRAGNWQPLYSVLLPGDIVPGDGSRDNEATVDTDFHERDNVLLRALGVTDAPDGSRDLRLEPQYDSYQNWCKNKYSRRNDLPHYPNLWYLKFTSSDGVGPLEILTVLSDNGGEIYTDALLNLDATYQPWTMRHTGSNGRFYPKVYYGSLTIHMLREHGKIRIPDGIALLKDALGPTPKNPAVLHALLLHPMVEKIKTAFDLLEPTPEFIDEEEPIPLTDEWPGLKEHLPPHLGTCYLIRCERILVLNESKECVFHDLNIYLSDTTEPPDGGNGQRQLQLVADELELGLDRQQIEEILQRKTPREVEERLNAIRHKCSTDAERLLAAVGEQALREGLPESLLAILESDGAALAGLDLARAAIATWHTDALKQYKRELDLLNPPKQWAGSVPAVEFAQALGFSPEWAGERNRKREPFLEVEGYSLPPLHGYQRTIANNVRSLLRGGFGNGAERRGMISLPTGSGKTRVAVQAVVEAMREDGFRGGVLWVADRDELCEQAVEAWRQVWSSIGIQAARLRISRMWGGRQRPLPTNELHVVVATRQTLHARLSEYKFLADFGLVVFDEAHRSLAPTFTSIMNKIGLTRSQRTDEPFVIGLTATPYRGRDEEETLRLVRRYGSKRLDSCAFASDEPQAVIQELQGMGVLAQADHETIRGETFSFDPDDLARILESFERESSLPWLPQSVEKRIARSVERTRRIVEAYEKHVDPDWPTLVFATSVEHAQTLAALLNQKDICSRAVSAETEPAIRRRVVEEFRGGDIKALVNYGVFSEGFDAPKTRAIIVARPVYSPNLYFQMIGRGLRGPLNGGGKRCLILNVEDNIENFNRVLAFSELDWLWAKRAG